MILTALSCYYKATEPPKSPEKPSIKPRALSPAPITPPLSLNDILLKPIDAHNIARALIADLAWMSGAAAAASVSQSPFSATIQSLVTGLAHALGISVSLSASSILAAICLTSLVVYLITRPAEPVGPQPLNAP